MISAKEMNELGLPNHPAVMPLAMAARDAIQPEDLWPLPLICSRRVMEHGQLSSWLKVDPKSLKVVVVYNLLYNASLLVKNGVGYALCLDNIRNTVNTDLCFRPLKPSLE